MVERWKRQTIGELGRVITGTTPPPTTDSYYGGDIPFIAPGDLGKSLFVHQAERTLTVEGLSQAKPVPPGSVLFSCIGKIGKAAIAGRELATNQQINAVVCDPEKADSAFVYYLLNLRAQQIERLAGAQVVPIINKTTFEGVTALIPPLPEQRKIAAILRTWDEAIEKLEALRRAKQKRLDGLTHALIFGKLGMNGQRRNWQPTRLSEVTFELTARNTNLGMGHAAVMGVTKARGIVPMREQTIGGDLSRYKRLPPRAFAYNPMRINVGSIAMNDRDEEVLVSPDYVVFGCTENGLAPDFLDHLRKTHWWSHHIRIGGSGSVRMRTYYDDLAAMKLPLPAYEEQIEVVAVLNAAQDDVKATEKASKVLTRQKRGLMQKLLTGEWRVNTADFCHPALRGRK